MRTADQITAEIAAARAKLHADKRPTREAADPRKLTSDQATIAAERQALKAKIRELEAELAAATRKPMGAPRPKAEIETEQRKVRDQLRAVAGPLRKRLHELSGELTAADIKAELDAMSPARRAALRELDAAEDAAASK